MSDEYRALLEKVKRILMCAVVAWAEAAEATDFGASTALMLVEVAAMDERDEIARENAVHAVERAINYSKKLKAAPDLLMLAYNDIEMRAWFARRY